MKKKCWLVVSTFILWTLLFAIQKPIFLMIYGGLRHVVPVVWHGLKLDCSVAGYLTAVPAIILLLSAIPLRGLSGERASRWLMMAVRVWFAIASLIVAVAFVANIALYGYWHFPLDATPLFFITSSPSAAMASVTWWQALLGVVAIVVVSAVIGLCFHPLWMVYGKDAFNRRPGRWQWLPLLLLNGLLFLFIRGGVTVSTMNTGQAYFCADQTLNHAAVNPLFSFLESVSHQEDFAHAYRFMNDGRAHRLFAELNAPMKTDSVHQQVINAKSRPDIYLIIMESFSDTLTQVKGVTPELNRLKREGVYFNRFYANGFRTDRGLVSILLGYPAPGAVSLMKYPRKTETLPSLAGHLGHAGYDLQYYYGGDADFTNMRSFLHNQGFQRIVEDKDFPLSSRLSKWGVPDHLLFNRVEADFKTKQTRRPTFTVVQTSSSHEPFDVPYHRLSDKTLNAFAYTDSCVGGFVRQLKASGRWNNSLVILVPDHLGAWPGDISDYVVTRFHIPMIWTGGAVMRPREVATLGSQQDIAATVLGQLGLTHRDMLFSKDLFDPTVRHYAYFMMNDGFGMVTDDNQLIFDNKQRRVMVDAGPRRGHNLAYGQAFLQVLFDDIARRR
jgi:phosphoglycerol transferase MdoB-like AlkP superfamily enzyme